MPWHNDVLQGLGEVSGVFAKNIQCDTQVDDGILAFGKNAGNCFFKIGKSVVLASKKAWSKRVTPISMGISLTIFSTLDFFSQDRKAKNMIKKKILFFI